MFLLFILCADELRQELRGLYPCIWQSESRNACTGKGGRTDFKKRPSKKGLKEEAHHATGELLKKQAPLEIINEHLIPALDTVGKGFEKGTVFPAAASDECRCGKDRICSDQGCTRTGRRGSPGEE